MAPKLFGTDGIRGIANREPITASTVLSLAMATASQFRRGNHRHRVVIGKDTRLSGYLLEPAMTAGFIAMGMDVILVGPLPTSAIAMLTRILRADLGVMISASHNLYSDNGIKLFGPDGFKLIDEVEKAIEERMTDLETLEQAPYDLLGRASRLEDASGRYIEYVKNTFPRSQRLDGFKIVIDCAHGAAYKVAPKVLFELGAEVIPIADQPDGFNINKNCGVNVTKTAQQIILKEKADLGLIFDGDADRLVVIDETGTTVDGDQIIALIATSWKHVGKLRKPGVVTTIMSNLGLEHYLKRLNLDLVRTSVGDRYVAEHMRDHGYNVGGEQSGHIVLSDYTTTGDGLVSALQLLSAVITHDKPVSQVCNVFRPVPQKLFSIPSTKPLELLLKEPLVHKVIETAKMRLGQAGRVLIRKSGTEPVIRIMAEGDDNHLVEEVIHSISHAINQVKV